MSAGVLAGCSSQPASETASTMRTPDVPAATATAQAVEPLPRFAPYAVGAGETFPNARQLAGRAAQTVLTYPGGTTPQDLASRLPLEGTAGAELVSTIDSSLDLERSSAAEVIYAQMSGTTETSFGAMVVVRQLLQSEDGRRRAITRTVDVRLTRTDGPWKLAEVASLGGKPLDRPSGLSAAARAVLDDERITLPDSARWDIFRGKVDDALLEELSRTARRHRFSVAVLSSGHPRNVWQTDRRSAHSGGLAADIYSVDGMLVIRQRQDGSAAFALAKAFATAGARQVGSPWDFDGPGRASFTDEVHQDHVHVQQRAGELEVKPTAG
ncbi:hypothetical protein GKE82_25380 [Conexibacter sp. W3-3-2]|uniref:hypothetical protein n=1 Tax=Conexibacter sp. W3-3-2 TaxID=2675227 RepID=UPI0012B75CF5|nr:hypothetical protein [Conexibacter sp. W3-3-2]MTD47540.1 hypothetical protein [Conexibacter sp. W3-3-2]